MCVCVCDVCVCVPGSMNAQWMEQVEKRVARLLGAKQWGRGATMCDNTSTAGAGAAVCTPPEGQVLSADGLEARCAHRPCPQHQLARLRRHRQSQMLKLRTRSTVKARKLCSVIRQSRAPLQAAPAPVAQPNSTSSVGSYIRFYRMHCAQLDGTRQLHDSRACCTESSHTAVLLPAC